MPAITTIIAIGAVVGMVGSTVVGTMEAKKTAKKQAEAAKKQSEEAAAALTAKKPSETTGVDLKLQARDKDLRRGKGSKAARAKAAQLAGQSASAVGGL